MKEHEAIPLPDRMDYPHPEMIARADAFYETMRKRHTVRAFSDRPVPREVIETAVKTAGTAPSGANHQPWFFSIIGSPAMKKELRERAEVEERLFYAGKAGDEWLDALTPLGTDDHKPYLETAPWIIAIFGQRKGGVRKGIERQNYYVPESVGIAMGFLIAALHTSGVVTLTHTPKPMTFLNTMCGRPASEKPYLLLVCGYPAEGATVPTHAKVKKPFDEIARFL
ncbi:nitroreductase family protein [Sandaracinobacteroides saxicola]|uniref:Nitroreductase family protein n=1 Tax=Sandaracinobacteroides saxicola TaxID=2759707 RepID=A0A7G5IK94_9SPHN|nr:nitroreductase family protein [Sandaracinobacteroides saxicola]QMW23786.1 nitroreductase family protein [Sandaracinobacteroides saxicola]